MVKRIGLFLISALLLTKAGAAAPPDARITVAPRSERRISGPQSAEAEKACLRVPAGFEVELVAAEPLVINPVTMTVDEKGRIYVSESHTYRYGPRGSPVKPFSNPLVRLDPLPGGKGYRRVVVAEGFDDPVMGIAVRGNRLWATANNFLYRFDLDDSGKASNRRTLVVDRNKAWNPFGMFVLEWGPDGLLYLSVGNHNIDLRGPKGKMSGRGGSGIIVRMKPDGSDMERLVHGLRVPYTFEYDPFGQLWLSSNGEGNPNRFVRVIEGVDYHCYSRREADNPWLAGKHPLAPPCFELMRGATTQLIRYYGAAYPASHQGSLLLCNWGAHGFGGPNRAVFRFVPDGHGNISDWEPFLSCSDPHFRPSHIALDADGNLLVADWYGRDDESDRTGRIWRVRYTGKDRPAVRHEVDSRAMIHLYYAVPALGSPDHRVREKAAEVLVKRGKGAVAKLTLHAAGAKEPLGASGALWVLARIGTPEARAALASGTRHADPRVRRLAVHLLRRYQVPAAAEAARKLAKDADPAVRVEAALALAEPAEVRAALVAALEGGAAQDGHLRYQAAWHLARHTDDSTLVRLLGSKDEKVRRAGLIAIDTTCYEGLAAKPLALAALSRALGDPDCKETGLALTLARMNWDRALTPGLHKLLGRADLPPAETAQALLLLRARSVPVPAEVVAAAGKRLLAALDRGAVRISSPAEAALLLEVLEAEGPTLATLAHLGRQLNAGPSAMRPAAHALARRFGPKASSLAAPLWKRLADPRLPAAEALEMLATLARIEDNPAQQRWLALLDDRRAGVRTEAVRWWRSFKGRPDLVAALVGRAPGLLEKDRGLQEDLAAVLTHLEVDPATVRKLGLPAPEADRDALGRWTLAALAGLKGNERRNRVTAGRLVFERNACVKCHTTVDRDTPLAPSLRGVARGQKPDYLVESVLFPSKVIKTGFETEQVTTKAGKVLTGLVKVEGKTLRVLSADHEDRVSLGDVEARAVQKLSLMPEGQEKLMSRQEFLDLIAYLASLR